MNGIDIRKMILDMRKHRMGLIQTADQLRFSYLAIIEGGKRILNKEQLSSYIAEVQTLHRLFKSHYFMVI
jgi:protein tyrosine phosphatase